MMLIIFWFPLVLFFRNYNFWFEWAIVIEQYTMRPCFRFHQILLYGGHSIYQAGSLVNRILTFFSNFELGLTVRHSLSLKI